jgi:hypothetical protein
MKEKMPEVAAILDWACEVFGKESVHGAVRQGLAGEPVFFASENGYEIGTPLVKGQGITWHPVTGNAIEVEKLSAKVGESRNESGGDAPHTIHVPVSPKF